MEYMAQRMDDQITGALSENERLCQEIATLQSSLLAKDAEIARLQSKIGFYESVSPQDIVDEANRPEPDDAAQGEKHAD